MASTTAQHAEARKAADTLRRPSFWWGIAGTCFPPLVALLSGWSLLAYRSGKRGEELFLPSTWARWDSWQYLSIARGGYTVKLCPKGYVSADPSRADYLCGNAGWFPGYPIITRWLSELADVSVPVGGLVVAWSCWYLVLLLMWRLVADARSLPSRWACLLIAAFFPAQVYFAALFPISLCIAGMLGCLYAVLRASRFKSVAAASLFGFVAAYSYIIAIALAPALLVTACLAMRGRRRLRALIPAVGIVAGFGAVLLTMRHAVGIWNAYFLTAEKYRVGINSPLDTLRNRLRPLWTPQPPRLEFLDTIAAQALLVLCFVLLAVAATLGRAVRRPATAPAELTGPVGSEAPAAPGDPADWEGVAGGQVEPPTGRPSRYARWCPAFTARVSAFDLSFLLAAVGAWLVPYIAGGQASTYRSEAFVILTVPLLRRLPSWLLAVPLAAAVLIAWHMAPRFFSGALV
jgi:hypothetical protein